MAGKTISSERKAAYYIGMALTGLGILLFLSTFVSGLASFGDFSDFEGRVKSSFGRAVAGMICIGVGQLIMRVGHSGLAGSGVKLDPGEARRDMEPWSRMSGGMLSDALDEAGIDLGRSGNKQGLPFDEQLRRLETLKDEGVVDAAEYEAAKKRILEKLG